MRLTMVAASALLALAFVAGCNSDTRASAPQAQTTPTPAAPQASPATRPKSGLANPASVNCGKQGGKTEIRKDAGGGEVGYCVFKDGSECEEWALYRGTCKAGKTAPTSSAPKRDPFARP